MKKNLLLLLMSATTLAGCNFSIDSIKFWNKENTDNNQQKNDNNSNQSDNENNNGQDTPTGTHKLTIVDTNNFIYDKPAGNVSYFTPGSVIKLHSEIVCGADLEMYVDGVFAKKQTTVVINKKTVWEFEFTMLEKETTLEFKLATSTQLLDEYTATIEAHGADFKRLFPEGYNFELSSGPTLLKEFIDDQLEYLNLISSVECVKCTSRDNESDTYFQIGTGSPAKGKFNEGTFKWNSIEKIYKVEITAFNYSNPYNDYSTGNLVPNVDTDGHIWIDDDDNSLEIGSSEMPQTKTFTKEYENGVNSFTLKATGGRILIEKMKITWRG